LTAPRVGCRVMPSYEWSAVSQAAPERVWSAWIDVASWSASDHIESASLEGEFQPGGVITSKAKGFPGSTLTITRVEPPRLWVDESRSFGMRMTFDHTIETGDGGTSLTERVVIRGPLGHLVGPILRRKLEALFAASVTEIARRAEEDENRTAAG
jgi:polyketide cyclase/dehydrase/lipid transport protein